MTDIGLSRGTLDPGLFSDNAPAIHDFYQEVVRMPFTERLEHADDYNECIFGLPEGKLKIQTFSEPMPAAQTGYSRMWLARDHVSEPVDHVDPDGLDVRLVPPGHEGVTNLGVTYAVADVDAQEKFLVDALGATPSHGGYRVGNTQLFVEEGAAIERAPTLRRGFIYITLVVHDALATRERLLEFGAEPSLRMLRLDDRCLFSWVRDPNGNWIETVQYAHLSGPLPEVDRLADHWEEVAEWRLKG